MDINEILPAISTTLEYTWVQVLLTILVASLATLIIRPIITRIVKRIISRHKGVKSTEKQKHIDTLVKIFNTAANLLIWLVAILAILNLLHVDIAALMTGAGLLGIVVGFGAQNTVRDLLAGVFIISENQYRVGDIVTMYASGEKIGGVVEDLTIRITRLRDLDGNLHTVRNGSAEVVSNLSFKFANVNVDLNVAYSSDIDLVEQLINQVGHDLAADEAYKVHFSEPIQFLRVDGFDGTAIRIKCLGTVAPAEQWAIAGEFRRRIKKVFDQNDISIPYSHVVIHNEQ